MEDCIFCKIVREELPSYKIYETESVLAFLDINPAAPGHTLIIPKIHYENIFSMPEGLLGQMAEAARLVALKMKESLGVAAVNLYHASGQEAEQTIFHAHLHVIPRKEGDEIAFTKAVAGKGALPPEQFLDLVSKLKIGE